WPPESTTSRRVLRDGDMLLSHDADACEVLEGLQQFRGTPITTLLGRITEELEAHPVHILRVHATALAHHSEQESHPGHHLLGPLALDREQGLVRRIDGSTAGDHRKGVLVEGPGGLGEASVAVRSHIDVSPMVRR